MGNKQYKNIQRETYNFTNAYVTDVYDGDTITIVAKHNRLTEFKVRLYGIDTPELRTGDDESKQKGIKARNYLRSLILNKRIGIRVLNNKKYNGKMVRPKYNRLIAIIYPRSCCFNHAESYNDLLINKGYATAYFGGTKET